MRVKRGTLEAEREGGRLYVLLRPDPMVEPTDRTDELIAELRERVRSLEDQLGQERHANKENRRIIAALTSRILELPAAQAPASPEPRESPPGAAEEEPARTTLPATRGPQEPVRKRARRSWWKEKYASAMVGMLTAFAVLAANSGENPLHVGGGEEQARVPTTTEPAPPPEPAPGPVTTEPAPVESAPEPVPAPVDDGEPFDPSPAPTDPVREPLPDAPPS
jgi:hypothetical protein